MSNPHPVPAYNQYKVRKITQNSYGDVFGITVPREVAKQFINVKLSIEVSGEAIIFKSGIDLAHLKKEIEKYEVEDFL